MERQEYEQSGYRPGRGPSMNRYAGGGRPSGQSSSNYNSGDRGSSANGPAVISTPKPFIINGVLIDDLPSATTKLAPAVVVSSRARSPGRAERRSSFGSQRESSLSSARNGSGGWGGMAGDGESLNQDSWASAEQSVAPAASDNGWTVMSSAQSARRLSVDAPEYTAKNESAIVSSPTYNENLPQATTSSSGWAISDGNSGWGISNDMPSWNDPSTLTQTAIQPSKSVESTPILPKPAELQHVPEKSTGSRSGVDTQSQPLRNISPRTEEPILKVYDGEEPFANAQNQQASWSSDVAPLNNNKPFKADISSGWAVDDSVGSGWNIGSVSNEPFTPRPVEKSVPVASFVEEKLAEPFVKSAEPVRAAVEELNSIAYSTSTTTTPVQSSITPALNNPTVEQVQQTMVKCPFCCNSFGYPPHPRRVSQGNNSFQLPPNVNIAASHESPMIQSSRY